MAPVTIKCAPAVEDRTVEKSSTDSYEESWEAVLFEKKEDECRKGHSKPLPQSRPISSKAERVEIIDLIEKREWDDLIAKIKRQPETASVILSSGAAVFSPLDISGNYVLHEVVKNDPPLKVVEVLISANETALKSRGSWGYLPIHYACTSGASADVVEALLDSYPNGVMLKDSNDHMLPLHLACKRGVDAEVMMALLTAYPEATEMKDDFGQTPQDYGRNIRSREARSDTLSCLEIGKWLCAASRSAKTRAEGHFELRLKNMKQDQKKEIDRSREEHSEEKARLMDFIQVHEMNAKDLEKKLAGRNTKVEELETTLETKTRDFESKLEAEKKVLAKTEVVLDVKTAEVKDMATKLDAARKYGVSVEHQLDATTEQHHAALEEVENLSIRLENVESLMASIRHLASPEIPVDGNERRENAPNNGGPNAEAMDKFRAKALKIGKKARNSKDRKRSGSETRAIATPKTNSSTDPVTGNKFSDSLGEPQGLSGAPPTSDE
jgi:hypothetical protein